MRDSIVIKHATSHVHSLYTFTVWGDTCFSHVPRYQRRWGSCHRLDQCALFIV